MSIAALSSEAAQALFESGYVIPATQNIPERESVLSSVLVKRYWMEAISFSSKSLRL